MAILVEHGKDISGTTAQRPSSAEPGQRYYNSTTKQIEYFDGSKWRAGVQAREATFTETSGSGTYTAGIDLPAGATIHDIIVQGVALWDNAGAVTMKVGDTDDDGFYTGINLKATDLLAGESLSFAQSGGKAGAYNIGTNTHWTNRYSASARTINGIVTTASTGGSAGRTRMIVIYSTDPDPLAATKA